MECVALKKFFFQALVIKKTTFFSLSRQFLVLARFPFTDCNPIQKYSMTTDKKRQRAGADALAAASKDKGKAPAAKEKKDAVAAAAANAGNDSDDDASSSDITSSSSAYSSDASDDDDDDDSDSGNSSDGGKTEKKEINVDFEFYDPKPIDFLGLKMLLSTWLDGLEFDSSGLCDALISQRTVGTVLKTEEAGDPIGVLSCLDARRSLKKEGKEKEDGRHVPALAQLERYLASCAPTPADAAKVKAAFAAAGGENKGSIGHTGVLVSERLLNIPPAVAQPLHEALFDEIAWATEDEPTAELKASFGFGQYLVVSRVYLDDGKGGEEEEEEEDEDESDEDEKKKKKKKQKSAPAPAPASTSSSAAPVVVFARPEDQFFSEVAEWSFVFEPPPLPEAAGGENRDRQPQRRGELRRARLVALVDASKVKEVREKLREAVGGAV